MKYPDSENVLECLEIALRCSLREMRSEITDDITRVGGVSGLSARLDTARSIARKYRIHGLSEYLATFSEALRPGYSPDNRARMFSRIVRDLTETE